MLKDREIKDIFEAFSKYTNKRVITKIMDNGKFYVLTTEDPSDNNNFDPVYLCNKETKDIIHSSILPTIAFIKMIKEAKKNVLWEK